LSRSERDDGFNAERVEAGDNVLPADKRKLQSEMQNVVAEKLENKFVQGAKKILVYGDRLPGP
jgi:hypothetical protein